MQLLLHLTYSGIHQEIMKQSLLVHAAFKPVHWKTWDTEFLYIHWFGANTLTRYWTKLYPSIALVLLYGELILLVFSPKWAVRISVVSSFPLMHWRRLWKWDTAVTSFWQCLHFPHVHLNYLHHFLPAKVCTVYLLLQVMGPRCI